jgi:curved DNA-binding protein CbpA
MKNQNSIFSKNTQKFQKNIILTDLSDIENPQKGGNNCPSSAIPTNSIDCTTREKYKKLSLILHPDKNDGCVKESQEKFKICSNQYDRVKEPQNSSNPFSRDFGCGFGCSFNFNRESQSHNQSQSQSQRDKYNERGYDKYGFHKDDGFNRKGYNIHGIDREGYNKEGFHSVTKLHKITKTKYDENGYDFKGYDAEGYDKDGFKYIIYIHKNTGTKYNNEGYDFYGFDINGIHKDTGTEFNREGFNRNLKHRNTNTILDERGFIFRKNGNRIFRVCMETGSLYDREGYDAEGYNKGGYDKEGCDKEGLDINGDNCH